MKRKIIGGLIVSASLLSAAAFAQSYVGVAVGQSDIETDCMDTTQCDPKDTGFKIFAGHMFTPNFGIEGAFSDLGKASVEDRSEPTFPMTASAGVRRYGVYGVAAWPVVDSFSLFAKLGLVSSKVNVRAEVPGTSASLSETSTHAAYALGAAYDFTKNAGVRFEWERGRERFQGEKFNADLYTVGLHYRF